MRATMNIPIWIKSEYVTYIGIPPFFRLEGCPSGKKRVSRLALWFPIMIIYHIKYTKTSAYLHKIYTKICAKCVLTMH